eukprot:TRINITY_DN26641_c0_g1_i5.p1 TRINITY_DN26641_c0_g1~~TRINITY_DN26641_c0_g1_i5.p1  ORF type:complete len:187 (+),score=22.79 TRINITY_DN26641_c0_g1_i5:114-674(+)
MSQPQLTRSTSSLQRRQQDLQSCVENLSKKPDAARKQKLDVRAGRLRAAAVLAVYAATYLVRGEGTVGSVLLWILRKLDFVGLLVLCVGGTIALGVHLRCRFGGPLQMRLTAMATREAMRIPEQMYARALPEGLLNAVIAYTVGVMPFLYFGGLQSIDWMKGFDQALKQNMDLQLSLIKRCSVFFV